MLCYMGVRPQIYQLGRRKRRSEGRYDGGAAESQGQGAGGRRKLGPDQGKW